MSPRQDAPMRIFRTLLPVLALLAAMPALAQGDSLKDQVKARMEALDEALDGWDLATAKRELAELEQMLPGDLEPLKYYQGRIAFEEGRYDEAEEALKAANVDDRPNSYLRLARESNTITRNHVRAESEHFIFVYPKGKDEILVPYALEALESMYRAMVEDLGWAPQDKVRVVVVSNARELARSSTLTYEAIQTTGTIAICKFNKIIVTSPRAVAKGYDWLDTLAHEYVHLLISRSSYNKVPIWLHEGLAKYLESRWRAKDGQGIPPATMALLGRRVKAETLVPFDKMHPSIAMLPTAEDATLAFAEVYYAIDYIHQTKGTAGLRTILQEMRNGKSDRKAVEAATGMPFALFEKAWLAHIKKQKFPKEVLPQSEVVLKENAPEKDDAQKGREISFGDFVEVTELPARKFAHLGELLRERKRVKAAAVEYAKAHALVGDKYESISNKYALALLELRRLDEAEKVLRDSLATHPGSAQTNVHLGRIMVYRKDFPGAKVAFMDALSTNPFDPEIHIALTKIHEELGETALMARTKKAGSILTDLTPSEVENAAFKYLREQKTLSEMNLPPPQAPASGTTSEKDGGP